MSRAIAFQPVGTQSGRMRQIARLAAGVAALCALLPGAAQAAPQLFSFVSGSASLTVEAGGVRLNDEAAIASLLGTSVLVELDPASGGPALLDFEFVLDSTSIAFDTPLSGVTALVLETTTIAPDPAIYLSPPGSDLGSGEYAVGGGPVVVSASHHFETLGGPTSSVASELASPGLAADLDLANGSLTLVGAALTILPASEDLSVPLVLKADIRFEGIERVPAGAIPEPSGALLLAAGLVVSLGAVRRRAAFLAVRA